MFRSSRMVRVCALGLGMLLVAAALVMAPRRGDAVPALMNYQGYITDNAGVALTGTYPMSFALFTTSTGGSAVWTESYASVSVNAGLFNVVLGSTTPLPPSVFTGGDLWLETTVNSVVITPRRQIVTVAYAFRAGVADVAVSGGADLWTPSGPDIYRATGKVGIGTNTPESRLSVYNLGGGSDVHGQQYDLMLKLEDPRTSTSGDFLSKIGFYPYGGAEQAYVGFRHNSYFGSNPQALVFGVGGGEKMRIANGGNVGIGTVSPGYPLEVASSNQNGTVAFAHSERTSGSNYAVNGQANGVGADLNVGGYFQATGAANNVAIMVPPLGGNVGIGTTSPFTHRLKVAGFTRITGEECCLSFGPLLAVAGSSAGIYTAGGDDYAIYAAGLGEFESDVYVSGTLFKSAGSFRIDHPLDPQNRYLSHSFVESPDMMNIYNGITTTDGAGTAIVELPDYFEALNRDFRYQLTVIGEFAQAIVSGKIQGNHFGIRTDRPNVEVSWQVTGVRKDRYAEVHPIVVEEAKKPSDRGKYLHPELFGGLREDAIGHVKAPTADLEKP